MRNLFERSTCGSKGIALVDQLHTQPADLQRLDAQSLLVDMLYQGIHTLSEPPLQVPVPYSSTLKILTAVDASWSLPFAASSSIYNEIAKLVSLD